MYYNFRFQNHDMYYNFRCTTDSGWIFSQKDRGQAIWADYITKRL